MAPLENYIVEHCAPTLACLKTGTLFCVDIAETAELLRQIALWNSGLGDRGVSLTLLRQRGLRALVYMYRRSRRTIRRASFAASAIRPWSLNARSST